MNFLLDTNILVHYIRKPGLLSDFENKYQPFGNQNVALISIVTEAEMKSLALQFGWEIRKSDNLKSSWDFF